MITTRGACSERSSSAVHSRASSSSGADRVVSAVSDDPASLYHRPGDVVEAEIDRIGILRNPVISWEEAHGS